MRLIDANKLKEELGDTLDGEPIFYSDTYMSMRDIEKAIDNEPTVEVVEQIKQMYQDEPSEMSPSYEYVIGWNEALDAILRELGEDVD